MSRPACLAVVLLAGAAALPAAAQTSPEEQARGLLEDGLAYQRQGKAKQALDNFQTIVSGFPNTASVDDALLEIGRYRLEVDNDAAAAREAFEQVTKRFPQSDGAPGAYHYLGQLTLDRATTPAELDDALAQFARVQRLYPRSDWVPRALHASAVVLRKTGRYADAADAARRVALEHPSSDAAPGAQFELGHDLALLGQPLQAMEEFQQVRNRWADSEWAERALDRITALYRLHGGPKPTFTADTGFAVGSGDTLKEVRGLAMLPNRTLWIASDKVKSAIPYGPDGKAGAGLAVEDLQGLGIAATGEVMVIAARAVRFGPRNIQAFTIPGEKPGEQEPLDGIEAAAVTPGGAILVSDEKKKKVFRFDQKYQYQGTFPDAKERQVSRIRLDGEGGIVLLDRDEKTVRVVDETGKVLRSVAGRGAGYEIKKPTDMAVDPFRNVYVLDEEGGVFVFSPQGALLARVGTAELRKGRAIALEPSGAVLVYDDKLERIVRFK